MTCPHSMRRRLRTVTARPSRRWHRGAVFGWEPGPTVDPTPFRIDRPVTVRIEAVASDERIERRSWLLAARIEAGDSGAALIDPTGTVVGVAYATTARGAALPTQCAPNGSRR